jgi:hypothetical protein
VGHRYGPGTGGLQVEIDGRWVPVEPGSVLAISSPDGEAHACRRHLQVFGARYLRIFCVILPGES